MSLIRLHVYTDVGVISDMLVNTNTITMVWAELGRTISKGHDVSVIARNDTNERLVVRETLDEIMERCK